MDNIPETGDAETGETGEIQLEVEIPAGCFAGDEFLIETPGGERLSVVVPPGSEPGMLVQIAVEVPPTAVEAAPSTPPLPIVSEAPTQSCLDDYALDEPAVDEVASKCAQLTVEPSWRVEEFDFDDSFLIQRSDGSYSEGWIKEYDESCDLYYVLIPGVGCKYVGREQIELNSVKD